MESMSDYKAIQYEIEYMATDLVRELQYKFLDNDKMLWHKVVHEFLNENAGVVAYLGRQAMDSIIAAAKRFAEMKIKNG